MMGIWVPISFSLDWSSKPLIPGSGSIKHEGNLAHLAAFCAKLLWCGEGLKMQTYSTSTVAPSLHARRR